MILQFAAIVILIILSAFFSGSETALFSLKPLTLRKMTQQGDDIRKIKYLLRNPFRLLATILIGNMLVNVAASSMGASVAIALWGGKGIAVSIIVMTFVLLLFGEVSPKRYAIEKPARVSLFSAGILVFLEKIFFPIRRVLGVFTGRLLRLKKKEPTVSEEELKTIIDIGHREGVVAGQEREMIGALLKFTDRVVRDVMTKKGDIQGASIDITQQEFVNLAKKIKHSKIPIFKNSPDNIMGIVYAKELFLYPEKPFTEMIKPVLFMHDQRRIKNVLEVFENQHIKIAIVFGQKGVVRGLVTMEDIIEEVFGEIYDEYELPGEEKQEPERQ